MTEFTPVKARHLKPAQRKAVAQIVRSFRNSERYSGVTSVRYTLSACDYFLSMTIQTRRSDCDEYSPRQVLCRKQAHLFIGLRGGVTVASGMTNLKFSKAAIKHLLSIY